MLDKHLVQDVLTAALSTGGDFAELFVENNAKNNIAMVGGVIEKALTGVDYGAGLRIFNGTNAVYAYTNDTARENLLRVALEAARALKGTPHVTVLPFVKLAYPVVHVFRDLPGGDKSRLAGMLKTASDAAKAVGPVIAQTSGQYTDSIQDVLIANSEGLWAEDRRVYTRLSFQAVAANETEKQTASFSPGCLSGLEFYEGFDWKTMGAQAAETAATMLSAPVAPSGKMPVVIGPGFGGVILHEACVHSLEATFIAKGASVFCGKLGQPIASEIVTAVDDGTMPNEWGSLHIDDEGTPTKRNVLVENGVLKTYLVDRLNGLKMGTPSTGSARRESYRYAPTSRMTNTFFAPSEGVTTPEDVVAATDYGLYAKKMGGGSVNPATGEFNFAVEEAYLIRGGKVAGPVRGATLIGRGSEVLMNIDRIASADWSQAQGMCGSLSGSVPTNVGQPTIRVSEMIVGGRG
ncbi:MAG: TldD/PmbA family protein [Oscillospiraceae bacterium]|jgi:TldD protein|nr:TldD/PmbA family protein [Oscillospiraceae bacterium]